MAIDDHPDVRCVARRHGHEFHQAAGLVQSATLLGSDYWLGYCDPCIDELAAQPDPVPYPVVYLDPARQRRPDPDHHDCPDPALHTRGTVYHPDPAP